MHARFARSPSRLITVISSLPPTARDFPYLKADIDGGNLKQLTSGDGEVYPHCSPDGWWVVYQQGYGWVKPNLWKVPLEGGEAMQLTETFSIRPFVAPDGELVAYYYLDEGAWRIGVSTLNGGRPVSNCAWARIQA